MSLGWRVKEERHMPGEIAGEMLIPVGQDADIVTASQQGRTLAAQLGFSSSDRGAITIAILEVTSNIIKYAGRGEIVLSAVQQNGRRGLVVVARDEGPGIPDIERALQDGYSTGEGLGIGLPGARRLMDEFEIVSEVGKGTTVTMRKWRKQSEQSQRSQHLFFD
jgi:serine/threonine-protein kinase RsbT